MKIENNPDWESNQPIELGDIIHLKISQASWLYKFKVIVSDANSDEVSGVIDHIFLWSENTSVQHSDINKYVGKILSFKPQHVFKTIKSIDAM